MTILGCLFCSSNNQISLWRLFDKSAPQKWNSFWSFCDKLLFLIFVYVQFGSISLVPNSLWYIERVLPVVYPHRAKRLSSQKFRSYLSTFPSERCWHIRCRSYSWLTTGENRLAKLIFILLFGFLKDKRKQDGVRACTKIIQNEFSQNDWTRFYHEINFHILHGRYPSKGHLTHDQIYVLIRCYFTLLLRMEIKNMPRSVVTE